MGGNTDEKLLSPWQFEHLPLQPVLPQHTHRDTAFVTCPLAWIASSYRDRSCSRDRHFTGYEGDEMTSESARISLVAYLGRYAAPSERVNTIRGH